MDDWQFYIFFTVFQSYQLQDGVMVKMEGYVQWNPVNSWKDFHLQQVLNPEPLAKQAST